jgi:hypothetical protein
MRGARLQSAKSSFVECGALEMSARTLACDGNLLLRIHAPAAFRLLQSS